MNDSEAMEQDAKHAKLCFKEAHLFHDCAL
jgi:hypothetical protein